MEFEILGLVLGFLQGIFEWLPISSEGQLVIVLSNFLTLNAEAATSLALFSHIGTAFVVLVYYRKEFILVFMSCFSYLKSSILQKESKRVENYENGLILLSCGNYGNVIRTLMPIIISDEHLERGLAIMEDGFSTISESHGKQNQSA